ncbi:hypothetical protein LCGC14_1282750, partial [marine sediment metagenome]
MDSKFHGYGFDGLKAFDMLNYAVERIGKPEAAYFYVPVNDSAAVQRAQYDILDRLEEGVELEPVKPENLHITLLYIEHIRDEDLEEIFERLNVIMPVQFEVEVSSVGIFPAPEKTPLVLHVNPDVALIRLQFELYNAAYFFGNPISPFSKPNRYKPHITIGNDLQPYDAAIPKLAAPFKVPVSKFVVSRDEYERFYTVHLPVITNDNMFVTRGGEGSGHFDHAGRPKEVGGSLPSGEQARQPGGDGKGPSRGIRKFSQLVEDFKPPEGVAYDDLPWDARKKWREDERKRILDAIESGELQKLWLFDRDEFMGSDLESWDDLDDITQSYLLAIGSARKAAWNTSTSQALALGLITPEEATEKGFYMLGGEKWTDLPETMFHVTTGVDAVLADRLKSRKELAMDNGLGLGGGDDETVSFTESQEVANGIYHSLIEAQSVAAGNKTVQDMIDEARSGENADRIYVEDLMYFWEKKWKDGDPLPRGVQNMLDGVRTTRTSLGDTVEDFNENPRYDSDRGKEWRPAKDAFSWEGGDGRTYYNLFETDTTKEEQREEAFNTFKRFSAMREVAGGNLDPLYWSTDVQGLSELDPSQIAIVQVRGEGRGYVMGALGEWRTTTGLATPITGTVQPGDIFRPQSKEEKEEEVIERAIRPSEKPPRFGSTLAASGPGVDGKSEKMFDLLFENLDVWPVGMEIDVGVPIIDSFVVVAGNQVISAKDKVAMGIDVLVNLIGDSDVRISAMDLRGGVPMSTFEGPQEESTYAVTRSALLQMLRGEPLVVGLLRRSLTIQNGPFVLMDDGDEPVVKIPAPVPVEFRKEEVITLPEVERGAEIVIHKPGKLVNMKDRIADVLTRFVDGVLRSVGIERHYSDKHPGTGTDQSVHAGDGGAVADKEDGSDIVARVTDALWNFATEETPYNTTGKSWITPDGRLFAVDRDHSIEARIALAEARYEGYEKLRDEAEKISSRFSDRLFGIKFLELGFLRFEAMRSTGEVNLSFDKNKGLTRDQRGAVADVMASFEISGDPVSFVGVDMWDTGQIAHKDALMFEAYEVEDFKEQFKIRVIERHGDHEGQEGREGAAGGSQPGYKHDGKGETSDGESETLFHGTGAKAARGIMESGLLINYADENNTKDDVVYATKDRRLALHFAARSSEKTYAIITIDSFLVGSKPSIGYGG